MDASYLQKLKKRDDWLPGPEKIFNAFSVNIANINYVLMGESPYPRKDSANGFAFWDDRVREIWSPTGLSKLVNRATSLRNIIKMLLVAEGKLSPTQLTQEKIAKIDKTDLIITNDELFQHFLQQGFLLLNTTLVLHKGDVQKDALYWHPFIKIVLEYLLTKRPTTKLLLFGAVAKSINNIIKNLEIKVDKLETEHPYNISFITNAHILSFFKPLHLLKK